MSSDKRGVLKIGFEHNGSRHGGFRKNRLFKFRICEYYRTLQDAPLKRGLIAQERSREIRTNCVRFSETCVSEITLPKVGFGVRVSDVFKSIDSSKTYLRLFPSKLIDSLRESITELALLRQLKIFLHNLQVSPRSVHTKNNDRPAQHLDYQL